jgi:4'-phosphopantetheinyl transferase
MIELFWLEQTSSDLPAHDEWLMPREAACLAGLRFPKRRADWRLGRWTAKHAVAAVLEIDPVAIEILGPAAPSCNQPVAISITHSHGRAACAVAPAGVAIGCDLERIESRDEAFITDYFTAPEREAIAADPLRLATLYWSAKESALKALGTGLAEDTRDVQVWANRSTGALRVLAPEGRSFLGWWWESEGFVRTVVTTAASAFPSIATAMRPHTLAL